MYTVFSLKTMKLSKFALAIFSFCLTMGASVKLAEAATISTIASGLDNPRQLTFGPDGALYVAEAGRGGSGPIIAGPALGVDLTYGTTGAVTRIKNGVQERIITNLPSFGSILPDAPPEIIGPAIGSQGIGFLDEELYLAIGYASDLSTSELLTMGDFGVEATELGNLVKFTMNEAEKWEQISNFSADLSTFEQQNNPDGEDFISNPYKLAITETDLLAIDSGANDLLQIDSQANITLEAVFNSRLADGIPIQSVPTDVAIGPDGAYYIAEFTGVPYLEDEARIYRVKDGRTEVYATGFTQINGLDFDSEGNLYVLEYSVNSLFSNAPFLGRLTMLSTDGTERQTIIQPGEGLIAPSDLEVSSDGSIYVSNFSVTAGKGEIIKIDTSVSVPEPMSIVSFLGFSFLTFLWRAKKSEGDK
jgi:DNA-binding beta-propeller fold protein YncE